MKKILICFLLFALIIPCAVLAGGAETEPREYRFADALNDFAPEELDKIHALLAACADVMEFDSKNPDYDALMLYILNSHENFRLLTELDPKTAQSAPQSGLGGITLVDGEFIDYILTNIFDVNPEHPDVQALSSRGFCYSGDYYYYVDKYFYFSTDKIEIKALYDLGGGTYYTVFTDIYTENGISEPEYSFAVIRAGGEYGYQILRIGMGLDPPPESEILKYAPDIATPEPAENSARKTALLGSAVLLGAAASAVGLILVFKKAIDR